MKQNQINKAHPELNDGEVWLTNAADDDRDFTLDHRSSWESIEWKTKRRGGIAYTTDDKPIKGMFPVFVQKKELIEAGIDPDKLWD